MVRLTGERLLRETVISEEEFRDMISKTYEHPPTYPQYYGLRDRALLSILRLTGKRVSELSRLKVGDLKVEGDYLSITFTIRKKRKKSIILLRREKLIPLTDPLTQYILEYLEWIRENQPDQVWLFPRTFFSPRFNTLTFGDTPLTTRQILRIVQKYNPTVWCHLFRETVASDIIRRDPTILSAWKVKLRLNLESISSGFRYLDRFARDVIRREIPHTDTKEVIV